MTDHPPICYDCRHCVKYMMSRSAECRVADLHRAQPDIVTGSRIISYGKSCRSQRAPRRWWERLFNRPERCGPEGRFFEQAPPNTPPVPRPSR